MSTSRDDDDDRPRRRPGRDPDDDRPRPRSRRDDDDEDDDDDRPRRRRSRRDDYDDYDDDDRPRARRRSRRDDDDDDRPRRRKSTSGNGTVILLAGGGGLLLVVVIILLFVWPGFLTQGGANKTPAKSEQTRTEIVGTWELTRGNKGPLSDMTVEFGANKRVKATYKAGAATVVSGEYEITDDGNLKTTFDGISSRDKIKSLTAAQLVLENEKGETEEYRRK